MLLRAVGAATLAAVVAATLLLAGSSLAVAEMKFSRPVSVVLPFPPGGSTDIFVRLLGQKIQEAGGPTIVVENKSGANGIVAATAVKQAAPDGHTLLLVSHGVFGINEALNKTLPYDALRDFAPVTLLRTHYLVCLVPPSLGVNSLAEFIDKAKKTPGGLSYASPGIGSGAHIQGAMLANMSGAPIVHVPYRGEAPAVSDLLGGRVGMLCSTYDGLSPYIESKKLKPIAVTGKDRFALLPDVPTFKEAGFPINDFPGWFGLVAPAGTPDEAVQALNKFFVKAASTPEIVARLKAQAITVRTTTPAEFSDFIKESLTNMEQMVKSAGLGKN
jgi:tripartite-type tricarboxylate transporter receptor subunit TctC